MNFNALFTLALVAFFFYGCVERKDSHSSKLPKTIAVDQSHTSVQNSVSRAPVKKIQLSKDKEVARESQLPPRYHPFFDDENPNQSVSVGTVTDGYLVHGREIKLPSLYLDILPVQYQRNLRYGTDELVQTLLFAAKFVQKRHPGSKVHLGNVARYRGGDLPYSVSHNSGRDADIALFATTPWGMPITPYNFVHFNAQGKSREFFGFFRFDVQRNLDLIRGLLRSPYAHVQFIFLAHDLRNQILRYAREKGLSRREILKIQKAVRQPRHSRPHDDHIHLRIQCSKEDLCHGCRNTGSQRPWMYDEKPILKQCIQKILGKARPSSSERDKIIAVQRMILLNIASFKHLRALWKDNDPKVRAQVAYAWVKLFPQKASKILLKALKTETQPEVLCVMAWSLQWMRGKRAALLAKALLKCDCSCVQPFLDSPSPIWTSRKVQIPMAQLCAHASAWIQALDHVPDLIALLDHPELQVRWEALKALRQLANRKWLPLNRAQDFDLQWIARAQKLWSKWYRKHAHQNWKTIALQGFQSQNLNMTAIDRKNIRGLVQAIALGPPWSVNAQIFLMDLTQNFPKSLEWSLADAYLYWKNYAKKRKWMQ